MFSLVVNAAPLASRSLNAASSTNPCMFKRGGKHVCLPNNIYKFTPAGYRCEYDRAHKTCVLKCIGPCNDAIAQFYKGANIKTK